MANVGENYLLPGVDCREEKYLREKELSEFPRYLRFDTISLRCNGLTLSYTQSMLNTIELFKSCLQILSPVLKDTNLTCIHGTIDKRKRGKLYKDHKELIEHFQNSLLPICDSSRGYLFELTFNSDKKSANNVLASIIQMPSVGRCSTLSFNIHPFRVGYMSGYHFDILPVEEISNWLHREYHNNKIGSQMQQEKHLKISTCERVNVQQICHRLKEVAIIYHYSTTLSFLLIKFADFYGG